MDEVVRKLAALLSADAVGYTRLMAADEVATVRTLTEYRAVIEAAVNAYRGRVVDSPGDNVLAEFPSALEAARCALELQGELAVRNAELPAERRMHFRMGVHLGDVMVDGDRIYGDGVNLAARLEGLAEPGSICVSGTVYEQVRGKLDAECEDLGERELKNVPHPIRVFRLGNAAEGAGAAEEADLAGRPAIAVLPFDNLSTDREHEFLADAIAADLIPLLSAWRSFPVIARNSTFTYKGRAVDVKQVSRELGARYLVTGSVRVAGARVRVSAELVDAESGHHVWAQKFDGDIHEIFELQDQVTEAIVSALNPALREAEVERARRTPPESLEAWALVESAWMEMQTDISSREAAERALADADSALERDPNYPLAHATRALALALLAPGPERDEDDGRRAASYESLKRALAGAPHDPAVFQIQGATLGNLGRTHDAIRAYKRALELDPSNAQARAGLGIATIFAHRAEEGLAHIDRARRLSPRDPLLYNWLAYRALACVILERNEDAVSDARDSVEHTPTRTAWMALAVALVELDRLDEAALAHEEYVRFAPNTGLAQLEPMVRGLAPTPEDGDRLVAAMQKVGF